jgi:uncharacterized protein YjbI with pentapeptide repeats
VGSHWSATGQIDVVAVNWDEAAVLYGECKWKRNSSLNEREAKKLFRQAEQIQLTTRSGNPLTRQYVFFSRAGFTEPARTLARTENAILADLAYLDLSQVNFSYANLEKTNLAHAYLHGAALFGANLASANLTGVTLRYAELIGANLANADLSQADLDHATLCAAILSGTNLSDIRRDEAILDGVQANSATIWPVGFDREQYDLFIEAD